MGVPRAKLIACLVGSGVFLVALAACYALHARLLAVEVVFYAALVDSLVAAALTTAALWPTRVFRSLGALERLQLVAIWLLVGYAFAISGPAVIERSLSFYLLEKLQQRGGGIRRDALQQVFNEEYMREYRVLDARLTEQLASGTILIEDGCVRLTERGQRAAAFSRLFRAALLPRRRRFAGDGGDTPSPRVGAPERADYSCP